MMLHNASSNMLPISMNFRVPVSTPTRAEYLQPISIEDFNEQVKSIESSISKVEMLLSDPKFLVNELPTEDDFVIVYESNYYKTFSNITQLIGLLNTVTNRLKTVATHHFENQKFFPLFDKVLMIKQTLLSQKMKFLQVDEEYKKYPEYHEPGSKNLYPYDFYIKIIKTISKRINPILENRNEQEKLRLAKFHKIKSKVPDLTYDMWRKIYNELPQNHRNLLSVNTVNKLSTFLQVSKGMQQVVLHECLPLLKSHTMQSNASLDFTDFLLNYKHSVTHIKIPNNNSPSIFNRYYVKEYDTYNLEFLKIFPDLSTLSIPAKNVPSCNFLDLKLVYLHIYSFNRNPLCSFKLVPKIKSLFIEYDAHSQYSEQDFVRFINGISQPQHLQFFGIYCPSKYMQELSCLRRFSSLTSLEIFNTRKEGKTELPQPELDDLDNLDNMPSLKSLYMYGYTFKNLNFLREAPSLEHVSICTRHPSGISFKVVNKIKTLYFRCWSKRVSLNLENFSCLETLVLRGENSKFSLKSLEKIKSLKTLVLHTCAPFSSNGLDKSVKVFSTTPNDNKGNSFPYDDLRFHSDSVYTLTEKKGRLPRP